MAKKATYTQPRIFIGSSKEALSVAQEVQKQLADAGRVKIWTDNVFPLTKGTLDGLLHILDESDFGIFVFSPDDQLRLRGVRLEAARDNVVFEFGLSVGRLGSSRTFFLLPSSSKNFRIATDLLGLTAARYDVKEFKLNPSLAVKNACDQVRNQIGLSNNRYARYKFSRETQSKSIESFMQSIVSSPSRIAIFTRDMSWAQRGSAFLNLKKKAEHGELVIFVQRESRAINFLRKAGAEIHCYSHLQFSPSTRFTILDFDRPTSRMFVGYPDGKLHVIEEFSSSEHAAVSLGLDLINMIKASAIYAKAIGKAP